MHVGGRPHHLRRPGRASSRRRPGEPLLYFRGQYDRLANPAQEPDVSVIPLSRPPVDDEIKQAVLAAIDSRQYILGPECREFEAELARYVGVRHCVLSNSATAGALAHPARARGEGRRRDPRPSHTAFPTIEAICFAEATPVFVDADAYYTMDPVDAAAKATPRTVGLMPVHLYGQPVDLDAVRELGDPDWRVEPRGLRAGSRRRLAGQEGRRLRPGGGLLLLPVQEPHRDGRRWCRRHRR